MITVEELNKYLLRGRALSCRRVVMVDYPHAIGTAFKISNMEEELFICDSANSLYFHSAFSTLSTHKFQNRCYYVNNSSVKHIQIGLIV